MNLFQKITFWVAVVFLSVGTFFQGLSMYALSPYFFLREYFEPAIDFAEIPWLLPVWIVALILVPAAYQVAFGTMLIRTSIEGISNSLFESALLEGANDMQIIRYIVLPMSKPILATVSIMTGLSPFFNDNLPQVLFSHLHSRTSFRCISKDFPL